MLKVVMGPCGCSSIVGAGGHSYWSVMVVGPVDVSGCSLLPISHGAGTLWPFINGGGGPLWPSVGACQLWWWAFMTNCQRSWQCWVHVDAGGCSSQLVGGGAGCQWMFIGGHHHFSIMVVGFMANHQWSWQACNAHFHISCILSL